MKIFGQTEKYYSYVDIEYNNKSTKIKGLYNI